MRYALILLALIASPTAAQTLWERTTPHDWIDSQNYDSLRFAERLDWFVNNSDETEILNFCASVAYEQQGLENRMARQYDLYSRECINTIVGVNCDRWWHSLELLRQNVNRLQEICGE